MHIEAHTAVGEIVAKLGIADQELDILDIGGQDVNGSVHEYFHGATWTIIDIADKPEVDIVADATTWVPPKQWDVVVCTEVLEHVENWRGIVDTAAAALKPGGYLILTCASVGRRPHGSHGEWDPPSGQWYGNVSALAFTQHANSLFSDIETRYNPVSKDLYVLATK